MPRDGSVPDATHVMLNPPTQPVATPFFIAEVPPIPDMIGTGEFIADRGSLEVRLWDIAISACPSLAMHMLRQVTTNQPAVGRPTT